MADFSCKTCIYYFTVKNRIDLSVCTNKYEQPGVLIALDRDSPCRYHTDRFGEQRNRIEQPIGSIRLIPLTQSKFAAVDVADYERLMAIRWHADKGNHTFYARGTLEGKRISMHRFIMNPPEDMVIDHIDGNGLNNTRANLRICTHIQNLYNSRPVKGTSAYKGVYWNGEKRKWNAQIRYNGRHIHIGYFDSEKEAARFRDKKAKELQGEFARLNFPEDK